MTPLTHLIARLSLLTLLLVTSIYAGRPVTSFPFIEQFNENNYDDIIWVSGNASHEWVSNQGWQGSGAAKFYPNTIDNNYMGLGQFTHFNNNEGVVQLNIRFLVYYGSDWEPGGDQNKVVIMNRTSDLQYEDAQTRIMLVSRTPDAAHPTWRSFGICEDSCIYEGGGANLDGVEPEFKIDNPPEGRKEEWISVELEANTQTGTIKLYIYTQDGTLSASHLEHSMEQRSYPFRYIDILGGYNNDQAVASTNNYYMIDELVIDDHYIGPPAGFVSNAFANTVSPLLYLLDF